MSRIIRTSSGVKFPSKEDIFLDEQAKIAASKKLSMLAREKKEQAEFTEKCVCYAIPPEFYGTDMFVLGRKGFDECPGIIATAIVYHDDFIRKMIRCHDPFDPGC